MRIALVQDWLTEMGGAEKVFHELFKLYPNADIYTLIYKNDILKKLEIPVSQVTSSFIQKLPFSETKYRNYLPLFPLAIESFDLSRYDLIISSSYAVAKGVLTHSNQLHICYCHSPVRYAWDLHHQYLKESGLNKGLKGLIVKYFLHKLRIWDISSVNRVDSFIGNSKYIAKRIKKLYDRDARVIYPPVSVSDFECVSDKEDFYLTCSRMVPYKKVDLIVESFRSLPDKRLVVIGTGPDMDKVRRVAGPNVDLMGYQSFEVLKDHMQRAKAFIYAAEEDFGIVPVEAQACGTPVIAFGKGGVTETVKSLTNSDSGPTGILFNSQDVDSLCEAIKYFEKVQNIFNAQKIRKNAELFCRKNFIKNFQLYLGEEVKNKQHIFQKNNK